MPRSFSARSNGQTIDASHVQALQDYSVTDDGRLTTLESAPMLTVQDEGTTRTTAATSINVVGAGASAAAVGGVVTLTIPGGSGSGRPVYNMVTDFGADNTAAVACDTAFQNALNAAAANNRPIFFPTGAYKFSTTMVIAHSNLEIIGEGMRRGMTPLTGSELRYTGTAEMFKTSGDEASALSAAVYTGTAQPLTFRNIALRNFNTNTPTLNGQSNYRVGTYAIRDWRSGAIHLDHVFIEGFEYGYWAVASDYSSSTDSNINNCHVGMYLGPRSDQNHHRNLYTYGCDTAIWIDGARGATFDSYSSDNDGSATTNVIRIDAANSMPSHGVTFVGPWLEHYGTTPSSVESFFEVGVQGVTTNCTGLTVINPTVLTNSAAPGRTTYLVKLGSVYTGVVIDNPSGDLTSLLAIFKNHAGSGRAIVRRRGDTSPTVSQLGTGGAGTWTVTDSTY